VIFLQLRMITDLFTLAFEEDTQLYAVGAFIAETYNRALRDVRLCCPNAGILDRLPQAKPWDRPVDLYLPVSNLLAVYGDHLTQRALTWIDP
jgi:hypothetical protein